MSRIVSIGAQIKSLSGLVGTKDISDWEDGFISSIVEKSGNGERTSYLTEKQVDHIDTLYRKHFA